MKYDKTTVFHMYCLSQYEAHLFSVHVNVWMCVYGREYNL